jgi:methionyl-tRNA formyltransferase
MWSTKYRILAGDFMQFMSDFPMVPKPKIVVFTGDFAHSVRKGIAEIGRTIPDLSWLIVIHTPKKPLAQLLKNQWRNLERNGWRWIPYQASDFWSRISARRTPRSSRGPGAGLAESALPKIEIQLIQVLDIHAEATVDAVRGFEPDLGISLAAPILRPSLFSIPRLGTLNLHKGRVPEYRGMPPAFWELWNDERHVGCTVHWVEQKLDSGDIVRETLIEREEHSTVRGLQLRLDEVGVSLMRDAVVDVLHGTAQSRPQAPGGKTNRKPTLAQAATLRRRLLTKQTPATPVTKRVAKAVAASSLHVLWSPLLSRRLRPRLTVLLYHRVSDCVRDNLTVGIEQFDRQMALLQRHCQVLRIEEVLALDKIPRSNAPVVCVTFDDGYLDNYTNAAPILLRHEIPAAFFVSTGIIGTDRPFPHDVRRGNPSISVMNWNHLRQMSDWGFTIGSHSVSHVDCAAEEEETVRSELEQSKADLQNKLGLDEVLFAYPYGGRGNMTPERLELVKQAGYAGCLSAYGGVNIGEVDRFNVLRRGIHWEFSDDAFLLECLGL